MAAKIHSFVVKSPGGNEEIDEFYVDGKKVGSTNHDEHGWDGMAAARQIFERTAKHLGATHTRR